MSDLSNRTILLLVMVSIVISFIGIFSAPKGIVYMTGLASSGASSTAFNVTEEVSILVLNTIDFGLGRVGTGAGNSTLDSNLGVYSYSLSNITIAQPPVRSGQAMAFDSKRNKTVLFGADISFKNDTWEYDGSSWTKISTATAPSARGVNAMAFDSKRNVIVLFGGREAAYGISNFSNETWEYDGSAWTNITTANAPQGRAGHAMAYDSRRNVTVLYGGLNATLSGFFNDTWEYNGTNWNQISTSTNRGLIAGASMAFDSKRNVIVMFGGYNGAIIDETWEYNGVDWTQQPQLPLPPARVFAALVFDSSRNLSVIIGGGAGLSSGDFSDSWEYDGSKWINVTEFGSMAADFGVFYGTSAFDTLRNKIVFFIGKTEGADSNVTLEYNASPSGGMLNGSWLFSKQYFGVENDGTVNISVNFSADNNADAFIGGTNPLFQIKGVVDESGACPDLVTSYTHILSSNQNLCPLLKFGLTEDAFKTPVKISIPSDAAPGVKTSTITFSAAKA